MPPSVQAVQAMRARQDKSTWNLPDVRIYPTIIVLSTMKQLAIKRRSLYHKMQSSFRPQITHSQLSPIKTGRLQHLQDATTNFLVV